MPAPQIPNLLSTHGAPRSGGPRSRGRGRGRGGPSQLSAASRRDQTIQATDTDAAVSRLSAVSWGYLDDVYAQYFVNGGGTRRLPIINRGMRPALYDSASASWLIEQERTRELMPSISSSMLSSPIRMPLARSKNRLCLWGQEQTRGISACEHRIERGISYTTNSTSRLSAPLNRVSSSLINLSHKARRCTVPGIFNLQLQMGREMWI